MFELDEVRNHAFATAATVFETMFYLSVEPENEEEGRTVSPDDQPLLRGEIEFQGRFSGRLSMDVPNGLAKAMAVNFLGLEESEVEETHTLDVVGEVCNMICGNLFSQLDKKSAYRLTPPRTRPLPLEAGREEKHDHTLVIPFNAEGSSVRLAIQFCGLEEGK